MFNLKNKIMKNLIFTLLLSILFLSFSSCGQHNEKTYKDGEYKTISSMLNQCKGTTIVLAVGENDGSFDYAKISIVVIDSTKSVYECRTGSKLNLEIGDTLKY
jgi:hypothetical protein